MGQGLTRVGRMRDQRRNAAILASSLGLHAAVLGYLAMHSLDDPRRYGDLVRTPPPMVLLDIEPRPLMRGERPRPPVERRQREAARPAGDRINTTVAPPSPSAPSPRPVDATAPAPPPEVGASPWQVAPSTLGDRIARNLRGTAGCASPQLLSVSERAACDQRFAQRAANAAPIQGSGDAARDGRFAREGARALARYEARRQPLSGRGGHFQPHDCGGSNLGFNCAGSHLDPGFRHDKEDDLNATLGRDRGDPNQPRLPHAATRDD